VACDGVENAVATSAAQIARRYASSLEKFHTCVMGEALSGVRISVS